MMGHVRIATWNVNSIRARQDRVLAWLDRQNVDVLAMQELKCKNAQFPMDTFTEAGYEVAVHGLNQWNGVAIASRVGLTDVETQFDGQPGFAKVKEGEEAPSPLPLEARALGATCGGVRIWNFYVPNGRTLTDPHMDYKLEWYRQLAATAKTWTNTNPDLPIALCGDWNVAPEDGDVWDPEFFKDKTHTSDAERAAFQSIIDAGYVDVVRPHHPGPGVYTYWDYTQLRFPKKQGMRIDFILGSNSFAEKVSETMIDRDERKGKGASDHTPVVVDLA